MSNIQLKITGTGDFSSITQQLKALQVQVDNINKSVAGVGVSGKLKTQLNDIQSQFKASMLSASNFTAQTVQLTSETEKFGKALETGKLSLGQYFGIITGKSAEAKKSVEALAVQQVKLNNSIVQTDITKQGLYTVYTPTTINKVAKATEIAAAKQNIFNLAIKEGSNQLINFGKNTQWAGRQLTVGLTMPVLLFGNQAMKTFQQVNDELVRMQKVYGTGLVAPTKAAIDGITKQVMGLSRELASSMGIAVKDTAAMAADIAATGKTGNDLIVATREAMRLSKLGELDTQAAMKATVSLQNVYKLSTQELSGAVNFLNAVENQTSTSLQDLVDGIPRVGPIVQQLGGSFKDTAVMMVAMKEAGVPAAQSANAIKSAIASLINPTKQAKDAFAQYNINLAGIATNTKGNPVQMIMQLQSALKGLAPLAQAQLIEKLFGKFQEARIQALITNLGAVNSQTKTAFDLVNATAPQLAAVAAAEMKVATESTTGKFKRAVETLKADLIPVGQKIMEVATSIMNFGAKIAGFFNNLPGPIKNGLGVLLTLGAIAGPIIMVTGLFANLMGQVIKVGYSLWGVIDGSKKWKDLMTPAGVAAKAATDLFNEGLMSNVVAVDNLNAALKTLIVNLEAVNVASTVSTVEGIALSAESKLLLPGMPGFTRKMATGGFVPGRTSDGDVYPAMLTGGEAVVPAKQAAKYAPFLNAIIDGHLPGYEYGTKGVGKSGESLRVALSHASPQHAQEILDAIRMPDLLAEQQGRLSSINAATKGSLLVGPADVNEKTKGGKAGLTGKEIAEQYRDMMAAGTNPLSKTLDVANKMGANKADAEKHLSEALEKMLQHLEGPAASTRFGAPNKYGVNLSLQEAQRMGQQHGGTLEALAGSYLDPAAGQVTATGKSGRRWSLRELQQNFIGTRGEGAGRSSSKDPGTGLGTTGRGYFRDPDTGKISIWSKSSAVKDFPELSASDYAPDFSTAGASAYKNITDVKKLPKAKRKQLEAESSELGNAIDKAFKNKEGIDANSDSKKAVKSGKYYVDGVQTALMKGKPLVEKDAEKLGETVHEGVDKSLNSSAGNSRLQGIFNKAFGPTSRLQGMMGKYNNMGVMGKMGLSMGATMLTQFAAPLVNKLPGGDVISGAMQGASMGAGFGPWGIAAGAAIGLVTSGIGKLIAAEKEHAAAVKASFTASADVISMYGGSIISATQAVYNFDNASKQSQKTLTQTAKDVEAITKMGKDNPLKQVGDLIKGFSSASSVIGTVKSFAAAQVAAGMDPSKVSQMVTDLLTYSGQTQYLDKALKEINHDTSNMTVATATWLNKLYQAGDAAGITSGKYSDLSSAQKAYADGLLTTSNIISDSSTPIQTVLSKLEALGTITDKTTASVNALAIALKNAGASEGTLAAINQWISMGVTSVKTVDTLLMLNNAGYTNLLSKDPSKLTDAMKNDLLDLVQKRAAAQVSAAQANVDAEQAKVNAAKAEAANAQKVALTKAQKDQIAALGVAGAKQYETDKKTLKIKQDQLKTLQQQTAELNKQQQYLQNQADLDNQIKLAESQGNYLQASLLRQQKIGQTATYNQTGKQDALSLEIDKLNTSLAERDAKIQNQSQATAALQVSTSALETAKAALKAAQTGADPKNLVDPLTKLLHDSGLGFKGEVDSKGRLHVVVDSGFVTVGGTQATQGSALNPYEFSSSQVQKTAKSLDYGNTMDLSKWESVYEGQRLRKTVARLAQDEKLKTGSVFQIPQNGKIYLFKLQENGDVKEVSVGSAGQKWTGSSWTKAASGGHITGPGSGRSDSIPAMLSNGEYVIKADTVSKYGKGFFDSVNAQKFGIGGLVGGLANGIKNMFEGNLFSDIAGKSGNLIMGSSDNIAAGVAEHKGKKKSSIWSSVWNAVKGIPGGILDNADWLMTRGIEQNAVNMGYGMKNWATSLTGYNLSEQAPTIYPHTPGNKKMYADILKLPANKQAHALMMRDIINSTQIAANFIPWGKAAKPFSYFGKNFFKMAKDFKMGQQLTKSLTNLKFEQSAALKVLNDAGYELAGSNFTKIGTGSLPWRPEYSIMEGNPLLEDVMKYNQLKSKISRMEIDKGNLKGGFNLFPKLFDDQAINAIKTSDVKNKGMLSSKFILSKILGKYSDKLPSGVQASIYNNTAVHRSGSLIEQILHPELTPLSAGRAFGPGTYFAQTKSFTDSILTGYGTNKYKMDLSMSNKIKTLFSKGYISQDAFIKEMKNFGKQGRLSELNWSDPFIQHLLSKGYIGLKHGDALTNWLIGAKEGYGLKPISKANGGFVLPSFDVGTDYVPRDMIAQIHKGEAIIPASQNNGTMGSTFNITVNAGSNASADDIARTVIRTIHQQQSIAAAKNNKFNTVRI